MQKILIRRIVASLILSVMLFALPVGAFLANSSTAVQVFAEDDVSGNETDGDGEAGENNGDNSQDQTAYRKLRDKSGKYSCDYIY